MASRIVRRPRFEDDLIDIWVYIAAENEGAADRFLARLEKTLVMLGDNPFAGRARPELMPAIRSFPVGNFLVFYRYEPEHIELIRVLSGYRDILTDDLNERS